MSNIIIWDEKSPINGVSSEEIFKNRPDLDKSRGDIFLIEKGYGVITEIQIGCNIAANYDMEPGLTLLQIAERYLEITNKESEKAEQEQITVNELQQEVALLSYELMLLKPNTKEKLLKTLNEEGYNSPKFSLIKRWYDKKLWTAEMVFNAINFGELTLEECNQIIK